MAEESREKWESKTSAGLTGASAEQVWPLLEDFCNVHKWFPIDTCYQVEGVAGQPGLIRYCASTKKGDADTPLMWAKEKLLMIDSIQRCLSYEVVDSNMGFKSYVATMKVLPINGDDKPRCEIEWSIVCDPVEGWTFQDLFSYIEFCLKSMAKKMEQSFSARVNNESVTV